MSGAERFCHRFLKSGREAAFSSMIAVGIAIDRAGVAVYDAIPAMLQPLREYLINVARQRQSTTYAEIAPIVGLNVDDPAHRAQC